MANSDINIDSLRQASLRLRHVSSVLVGWLALLFLFAGVMVVQPCAGAPFQFEPTGSLVTARLNHTTTLLANGKVLIAGGSDNDNGPPRQRGTL